MESKPLDREAIEQVVVGALATANRSRPATSQLDASSTAAVFGADSPLDSLGLVALLIDIEEALSDRGAVVTLTDSRAMSRSNSPFRAVPTMVDYIAELLSEPAA